MAWIGASRRISPYAGRMNERVARPRRGAFDGGGDAVQGADRAVGSRGADDRDSSSSVDLVALAPHIAARLDAILDVSPIPGDEASWLRRPSLATTVVTIAADGSVNVVDDGSRDAGSAPGLASSPSAEEARVRSPRGGGADASPDVASDVDGRDLIGVADLADARRHRGGVDDRLRDARRRLEVRRRAAVRPERPRYVALWRDLDARRVAWRLVAGLVVVGASAVISVLLT